MSELLSEFTVVPSDIPEPESVDPWETAAALALAKAQKVADLHAGALVIGADTVVAIQTSDADGQGDSGSGSWIQLGKPCDEGDASRMLRALSGHKHIVITGLAIVEASGAEVVTETTHVAFRPLTDEEIAAYVNSGEPMDKAGAYAIQGGARDFVTSIDGSWSNVVGLPLERLREMLGKHGIPDRARLRQT